jgi:hypothetical protein
VFAQALSRQRRHSLDDDVKLFFTLGNALMDASIAAWAWKYKFESGGLHGRSLGNAIGGDAWVKAQSYIRPFTTGPI